jgi:hypothetical protein
MSRAREFLTGGTVGLAIERAGSLASARELLEARAFDVMLIDLASFCEARREWPDPAIRAELFPATIVLA